MRERVFRNEQRMIALIISIILFFGGVAFVPASASATATADPDPTYVWQQVSTKSFLSIAYGNGLYVAITSERGFIYTSTDLVNWNRVNISSKINRTLNAIEFLNGKFYVASSRDDTTGTGATVISSINGSDWTVEMSLYDTFAMNSITYGNNKYVMTAINTASGYFVSTDGTTWNANTHANMYVTKVLYANGQFMMVGCVKSCAGASSEAGTIMTSTDGVNWSAITKVTGIYGFTSVTSDGAGTYVAVGYGGQIYRTDPSSGNMNPTLAATSPVTTDLSDVRYSLSGGGYAAVGISTILFSTDGVNWTKESKDSAQSGRKVIYGNNEWVVVGSNGVLVRKVEVNAATPSIGTQPQDKTVNVGSSSPTLSVAASVSDGGTLSYQWYSNTTDSAIGGTAINGAINATYAAPTVTPGMTYYYVVVTNTNSSVSGSKTATVTSSVATVTVKQVVAPIALSATSGDAQVTLTWSSAADAVTYNVYAGTASGSYEPIPVATVNGSTNISTIEGLANGTTYYFAIKAISTDGFSSRYSNEISATPIAKPNAPVALSAIQGDGQVTLAWSGVADAVTYNVYAGTVSGSYEPIPVATVNGSSSTSTITELTNGTTYYFAIKASNTSGCSSYSNELSATPITTPIASPNAPVALSAMSGDGQVTLVWSGVSDAVTYSVYAGTVSGSYELIPVATVNGSSSTSTITELTNGTTYYFAIKASNTSGYSSYSNELSATPIATLIKSDNADLSSMILSSGILSPAFVSETTSYTASIANSVSSVTVTPTVSDTIYGSVTASVYDSNGTMVIEPITVTSGTASPFFSMNVGSNTIKLTVTAQDGTIKTYKVVISRETEAPGPGSPSNDSSSSSNNSAGFHLIVNGKEYDQIATGVTTEENGETVLTTTVDTTQLTTQLGKEGDKPVIIIPASTVTADKVNVILTGEAVKAMENKQAVLEVQTAHGNYKLPAAQIIIDSLALQLGKGLKLSDIIVHVEIAKGDASKVQLVNHSAEIAKFNVIVPPVDFTVTASYNGHTATVEKFSSYVEREIPLPDSVDPNQITTATVLKTDGSVYHVPTSVTLRNGKYVAVVNSLTNSSYTLIQHAMSFADVEGHWSQTAVNDMASRMIVKGADAAHYNPDKAINRAEFAAIVVRALGLAEDGKTSAFTDVVSGDWYLGAVAKAKEYGIIDGYDDGTFRPSQTITREEAMVMIARSMTWTGLDTNISKSDADTSLASFIGGSAVHAWAKQAVAAAVINGLVSGSEKGLQPTSNITRAETAAIVQRMLIKAKLIDNRNTK